MKYFKEHLIDKVNPDLLYRLWQKSDKSLPLIYKKYGTILLFWGTPYGELRMLPPMKLPDTLNELNSICIL